MLSRPVLGRLGPRAAVRCFGRYSGPPIPNRSARSPFDHNQNEDGFMIVGKGTEPSVLRPNLASNSSTTSDENWARILDDVDPPSPHLLHPARALRPGASLPHKKHSATEQELRAMEDIFERVFDMDRLTHPQAYSLGAGRTSFLSNSLAFPVRRPGEVSEPNHELQFDKKREEMFGCKSDKELLQWAIREVFIQPSTSMAESSPISPNINSKDSPMSSKELHPDIYGRMVSSLMKEFRDQYNNPHLAMAIFDYTRRLSITSYVTGCTAPSYNELMRTHWSSFRNLQAVVNVAEEMRVNGVLPDHATTPLLNQIRDDLEPQAVEVKQTGGMEVVRLLERLDELLRPPKYEPIVPLNWRYDEKGSWKGEEGSLGRFLASELDSAPSELAPVR